MSLVLFDRQTLEMPLWGVMLLALGPSMLVAAYRLLRSRWLLRGVSDVSQGPAGSSLDEILPGSEPPSIRASIEELIRIELQRAYAKHGSPLWGRHEFYGILKEEVDELWEAIRRDQDDEDVIAEAIEVAAMCVRYLETNDRYRGDLTPALRRVRVRKLIKWQEALKATAPASQPPAP